MHALYCPFLRRFGLVSLATLLLSGCASAPPPAPAPVMLAPSDPELDRFAWLVGSWTTSSDGVQTDEHWSHPAGGTMLGMSRTIRDGKTVFFENLRIEKTAEGIVYLASPRGRDPATPFLLIESDEGKAVFENSEHDFPQRIQYWREGELLRSRIEGTERGRPRSEEWTYRRAALVTN